mmetsp:Transcript_3368/g.5276  ORF Transcript_3368/g.5276 Transcript_3368/m.5276 type:complete len:488 (-) Transcript_3368:67-1530(-)
MTQPKKKKNQKSKKKAAPAPVEETETITRNIDEHPLRKGHFLVVRYRDNSHRLAKIIESNNKEDASEAQYYVHYEDFNRRMDEWVNASRIEKLPSEANVIMKERRKFLDNSTTLNSGGVGTEPLLKRRRTGEGEERSETVEELQSETSMSVIDNDNDGSGHHMDMGVTTVHDNEHDEHEGMDEHQLQEHEEITKVKNIRNVQFGRHVIECWYYSPFPKEFYPDGPVEFLYFCEFSFRFFRHKEELVWYQQKSQLMRCPPGNEIYRDSEVSMFEVDGAVERYYCQNLSYFAKLFLDHKTLYYDVDPFLFYVLCSRDEKGYHPVGYFSKEKFSDLGFNLACILTFPFAQRKGYGRFLIAFSYELSKKEEKVGSPEKPLSDLGAVSYRSYWASTILTILKHFTSSSLSIMDLSKLTSIVSEDIISTLQHLNLLRNISGTYIIYAPPNLIDELMEKYPVKGLLVDPSKLHWTPLYVTDVSKDKWSFKAKKD